MNAVAEGAGRTVLAIAPAAYPLGGVATWLDTLLPGLARHGWRPRLALLAGHHHEAGPYLDRHPWPDARFVLAPTGTREGRVRALVRRLLEVAPTHVLSFNVGDVEEAVRRVRERLPALRLVTTQHALQADFLAHLRNERDAVDAAIATNRLTQALLTDLAGLEPERALYAPYGVALDTTRRREASEGSLRILWAGRVEEIQKRALDLAAIVRELEKTGVEFRLDVAGSGTAAEALAVELAPAIVHGAVRRLGDVPAEVLRRDLLPEQDVLLVTSTWETGPIVAWEALAAGVAVVAARFLGSGREAALIDGESAWLYPVGDAAAAARALAAARDVEERTRRAEAGRRAVAERYEEMRAVAAWSAALARAGDLPRQVAAHRRAMPAAGRLDRWLGVAAGESLRAALGGRRPAVGPGDEWPHAYAAGDEAELVRVASRLDAPERR